MGDRPRLLITGAFGRLGRACLLEASRQGYEISAFDVRSKSNRRVAAEIFRKQAAGRADLRVFWGDIRRIDDLKPALEGADAVIHHAGVLPPVTEDAPDLAREINVAGTRNVIRAVGDAGRPMAILYPSSLTVFGIQQHLPPPRRVDEPTQATDHYTDHKLQCEQALIASGLPHVIFRIGVSVDAALQRVDKKTLASMLGVRADNRLEYVHPDDVATAMVHAVGSDRAAGKILLVGGGRSCQITQRDLIDATLGAAGLTFDDGELGTNDYYTDWLDTEESQEILRYQATSFDSFRRQMRRRLRFVRPFVRPLAPVIKPLLKQWLAS